MLIKTFKFLIKEKTMVTQSFRAELDGKTFTAQGDHHSYPLSITTLGNKIVGKYIDLIILKYNIPLEEVKDRVKIKVTTANDEKTGETFIVYVCVFCGINYRSDITIDDYTGTDIEESAISEDALMVNYQVSGEIEVTTEDNGEDTGIIFNQGTDNSINICIDVYDRYGSKNDSYLYTYVIGEENRFTSAYKYTNGLSSEPEKVIVPYKGRISAYIHTANLSPDSHYIHRNISNITDKRYPAETYNGESYLNLGKIKIQPGLDSTMYYGKLAIYDSEKIINSNASPITGSHAYVRMFNINEYGEREYNKDEQDLTNIKSYIVNSGDEFEFEINHAYPYIEFCTKDSFNTNINIYDPENYSYMYHLTEFGAEEIRDNVILYQIKNISYQSINVSIDDAPSSLNTLECELLCYYDSDTPFYRQTIILKREDEFVTSLNANLTGDYAKLPKYSRFIIKAKDDSYASKFYNIDFSNNISEGIVSSIDLIDKEGESINIKLYATTSYQIYFQKFYGGGIKIQYTNLLNNFESVELQQGFLYSDLFSLGVDSLDDDNLYPISTLNAFKTTSSPIIPMPGTPIFIQAITVGGNAEVEYSGSSFYKSYMLNNSSRTGHIVIDNNCNVSDLSTLQPRYTPKKYYFAFNNYDTAQKITKNVRIHGTLFLHSSTFITNINRAFNNISSPYLEVTHEIECPVNRGGLTKNVKYKIYSHRYYTNALTRITDNTSGVNVLRSDDPDYQNILSYLTIAGENPDTFTYEGIAAALGRVAAKSSYLIDVGETNAYYLQYPAGYEVYDRAWTINGSSIETIPVTLLTENIDNNEIDLSKITTT